MKSLRYIVLLLLIIVSGLSGCKKEDSAQTNRDLLMAKQWKLLSAKDNGVTRAIDDCDKDDYLTFLTNGTVTWDPGAVKCDPGETTQTISWSLASDGTSLTIEGNAVTILELTATRLRMSGGVGVESWEETYVPL